MRNHCEGCYSYEEGDEIINCEIAPSNNISKCPCSRCLIKVMCKVGCDDFENYYDKFLKDRVLFVEDLVRKYP